VTARDVSEATTVGSALALDLLITDYLMPDGTGEELIAKLREHDPSLKVLLISGHHGMLDEAETGFWKRERHLSKPFTVDDLRTAVADLVGSPQSDGIAR
jgi:DNA-binding NtrC family response regulator